MLYSRIKQAIESSSREDVEEILEESEELLEELLENNEDIHKACKILARKDGSEILSAAMECSVQVVDIDKCYQGCWNSDEEFTQDLVESTGDVPKDLPNYVHIDWERTAQELMMDYSEQNGYYFRNL